ncbi:MAG TPA: DUF4352 domain-containing protein, partial [Ktedonobacteraceae bacterium]|nr:DUF4352 domain-containing protein [Ktedonobacteraceae bacterium]
MLDKRIKLVIVSGLCALTLLLAACGGPTSSPGTGQTNSNGTSAPTTVTTANATVVTGSNGATNVTPPSGPTIVTSPTPIPGSNGKGQQLKLADRILLITSATKQNGADPTSVSIVLALTVKNTSPKGLTIQNQPEFFQLVGSEGDTFGKQSNSSDSFYGPINANSQRSGTIVFQIPAAAVKGLRLMYRTENQNETVF